MTLTGRPSYREGLRCPCIQRKLLRDDRRTHNQARAAPQPRKSHENALLVVDIALYQDEQGTEQGCQGVAQQHEDDVYDRQHPNGGGEIALKPERLQLFRSPARSNEPQRTSGLPSCMQP